MTLDDDEAWIVEWIRQQGPIKSAEIAEGLSISRATAVRKLNRLCDKGFVQRSGRPRSPELTYSLVI